MGGIEGTAGGETHPQEPISNFGIGLSPRISTSRIIINEDQQQLAISLSVKLEAIFPTPTCR